MKYIFRGRVVLDYNEATHNLTAPMADDINRPQLDMCKLIPEDYALLQEFLQRIQHHIAGINTTLEDIEVN